MHDVVEVVGHIDQCPLLRFVGRDDAVVDLHGEKLHEIFAAEAVRGILGKHGIEPRFAMLAPKRSGDGYILFMQTEAVDVRTNDLGNELDAALRTSFHYDYCRRLGQLHPCSILHIDPTVDAATRYLQNCVALGQRLGDIKPTMLHPFRGWTDVFGSFSQETRF